LTAKLSAVIVTQNEEKNIGRCLGSLKFADEIVVVDAFSEDRTVEIARAFGARVVSRKWDGFATQKQFAIGEAGGEWVLLVDSDEAVSGELAGEIRAVVAKDDARPAGFRIRRSNYFLGEPMPFGPWGKDYTLRLFRKTRGAIDARPVHEGVRVDGEVGTLEGPLFHYTHQTLSESFRRLDRYTTLEAVERAGRRPIRLSSDTI
jgi:glycosyltransferase involved in cell wall biosynthesis